jgi:hypothetical protein
MFDIFTVRTDGIPQHLISIRCLTQAQEMACQLSLLAPGEYFGYFKRTEVVIEPASELDGQITNMANN